MPKLNKKDCYVVDSSNKKARSLMLKLSRTVRPGAIIFVTEEEFKCLKESVIRLEVPEKE